MTPTHLPRLVLSLALAVFSLGLVSCASGPTYEEMKSKLPPVAKGAGRVFVYRPSTLGFGVKPSVKIDDKRVCTSEGRGFFYTDQTPGRHEISITTEWKHKNTFNVVAGMPTYVECTMTPGVFVGHLIPNEVDAATGEARIQACKMASGGGSADAGPSGEPAKSEAGQTHTPGRGDP